MDGVRIRRRRQYANIEGFPYGDGEHLGIGVQKRAAQLQASKAGIVKHELAAIVAIELCNRLRQRLAFKDQKPHAAALSTSPAFYEVFDCKRNIGFRARDVISGEEREVSEGLASATLSDGDIMFGHLVAIDETTMLESISPLSFPPVFKQRLIRLCRRHALRESPASELRKLYFAHTQPSLCRASARR